MIKEIYDQPKIIRNIARNYSDQVRKMSHLVESAKGIFIGAGTAYHAGWPGLTFFKNAHMHVNTSVASEFNYLEDFLTKKV